MEFHTKRGYTEEISRDSHIASLKSFSHWCADNGHIAHDQLATMAEDMDDPWESTDPRKVRQRYLECQDKYGEHFPVTDRRIDIADLLGQTTFIQGGSYYSDDLDPMEIYLRALTVECEPQIVVDMLVNTAAFIYFTVFEPELQKRGVNIHDVRDIHDIPDEIWESYNLDDYENWYNILSTECVCAKIRAIKRGEAQLVSEVEAYLPAFLERENVTESETVLIDDAEPTIGDDDDWQVQVMQPAYDWFNALSEENRQECLQRWATVPRLSELKDRLFFEFAEYDLKILRLEDQFRRTGRSTLYDTTEYEFSRILIFIRAKYTVADIPFYTANDPRSVVAEHIWISRNKPTYRIWPSWVQTFTQSKLIDFPTNMYVQPYSAILIVLPKGQEVLSFGSSPHSVTDKSHRYPVHWMLLSIIDNDALRGTCFEINNNPKSVEHVSPPMTVDHPLIFLHIEYGPRYEGDDVGTSIDVHEDIRRRRVGTTNDTISKYCALPYNTNLSLAEQLEYYNLSQDFKNCWAVALSVAYLATCQYKLIEPDVLNCDIDKYLKYLQDKDLSHISRLHAKATKRRKHISYAIGRNTNTIMRILGETSGSSNGDGEGHELHFRHIRRFHFRRQFSSENENGTKIITKIIPVMETIVRPDLPERTYDLNHRSLDNEGK